MRARLAGLMPDGFLLAMLGTLLLAFLLPASGTFSDVLTTVSRVATALLFLLYGARLPLAAVVEGIANWKLQLASLTITFGLFPVLVLIMVEGAEGLVAPELLMGFLFLGLLPSTVQSSVAMVGIAGGNVSGAICCASVSNLAGVFLTPLLALALMGVQGGGYGLADAVGRVALQILLPFLAGMAGRQLLASAIARIGPHLRLYDRGVILLISYVAISAAVTGGEAGRFAADDLVILVGMFICLLVLALAAAWGLAGLIGLKREERIALLFCGSQKSLASGVPIAAALFPAGLAGTLIVPVILYHQLQLVLGTLLSSRLAARTERPQGI